MLVVMGPVLEVPVTDLFAAAIIPGVMLAVLYTALCALGGAGSTRANWARSCRRRTTGDLAQLSLEVAVVMARLSVPSGWVKGSAA